MPIGGAVVASVLAVIVTPHVHWVARLFLAAVVFLYIGGQSAAYLWPSADDQGS